MKTKSLKILLTTPRVVLREQLDECWILLLINERKRVRLRFGLDDGKMRTLEDVGKGLCL